MNNNNRGNNNNRRRGRGNNANNNSRPGGGGQPINRVDSRARGNAPQLLEKYRKMAHDGHLNGDRVTEEYYLQFADHYFRVMADTKVRQDESRQRRDDRWQEGSDAERAEPYRADSYRDEPEDGGEYGSADGYGDERGRGDGGRREPVPRYEEAAGARDAGPREAATEQAPAKNAEPGVVYEPPQNPFVREGRGNRGVKPRRPRGEANRAPEGEGADVASVASDQPASVEAHRPSLDPSVLPPAISIREGVSSASDGAEDEAEAKPRRRTRRARPTGGDNDETLQAVN